MRLALAATLLALAACAREPDTDAGVLIVWNRVDDAHAACQKVAGRKEVFAIHGCTKWIDGDRSGQRICKIYAPEPDTETDTQAFATLGHELMHCFDSNWHDRWGRMKPEEDRAAAGGSKKRSGGATAN